MEIRKLEPLDPNDSKAVDRAFEKIAPEKIACCNWPDKFPYAPKVQFRIFHTGDWLMLRFEVEEQATMALVSEDNGKVWTDSCVEFFIAPDRESYYNFECNCIGRLLLGYHKKGSDALHASPETLASVKRYPTLGTTPFAERKSDNRWQMTLAIPPRALFRHTFADWSGVEATANFYKCGDHLSQPHFLSWRPIASPKPDFHRPEFFEQINLSSL